MAVFTLANSLVFATSLNTPFTVKSSEISAKNPLSNKQVFKGFGCEGENVSPELSWTGAPEGTKSYAVTAFDPDAPTGSGWWHWTVVNIPVNTTTLASGAGAAQSTTLPAGAVQGRNDFGYAGFGGACPPAGDKPHRYQFRVWALKVESLPLDAQSSGALVGFMLHANSIGYSELTVKYGR
ncbi:MAG: hypothetical protein XXXJIFNMEKO3_01327 [Candidatus Erwinia impunctatus]|nr:hypothetical protein XXXJIFNMEKO_01327 [Culicoides impunctatus]